MGIIDILFFLGLLTTAFGADCISNNGNRCWTKGEVGGLSVYMQGGNPCFSYNDERWCFTGMGPMAPCTCKPECGCGGEVKPPPKCDNSVVPQNPDCSADKNNYCKVSSGNTMCTKCGMDMAACNNKVCQRDLTPEEQAVIVKKSNDLRRRVAKGQETLGASGSGPQPKAADMYELVWSDELAKVAQRWGDQCPQDHDKIRNTTKFGYVGQNMAWSWAGMSLADKGLEDKVQGWYDEVKDWPSKNVGSFSQDGATGVVGHYTQLIWGAAKEVGCGFVQFVTTKKPDTPYEQMLVCNYGPGGNILTKPVYKVGEPGSACPNGHNDGLCKQ